MLEFHGSENHCGGGVPSDTAQASQRGDVNGISARVLHGDCIEIMETLDAESIDAVVCDPPYELNFMGRDWDNAGISFSVDTWKSVLRVLKPGGHLLAFGGTRTYHRMTVAIEDAGFDIRDSLHWIYGSGFPKSLDVSKAIDKAAGEVTIHATDQARQWDGWGTGLKPAHEPIVLARKQLEGTVVATVLEHGTGAINIEGTRVGVDGGTRQVVAKASPSGREATSYGASIGSAPGGNEDAGGRWPTNVLLSHLPDCEGSGAGHTDVLCAPGCPIAELNEASGDTTAKPERTGVKGGSAIFGSTLSVETEGRWPAGPGGAARFFYIAKPRARERVGGTVRNLHPTVKPIDLMRYLVRLVTPPGGVVLDPFLGSGTTGCAAMVEGVRFVGIERDDAHYATALARVSDYAFAQGRSRPLST